MSKITVKCKNCKETFDYHLNKGVCPYCERFNDLPEEEKINNPKTTEYKESVNIEAESQAIEIENKEETAKSNKRLYMIIAIFFVLFIAPIISYSKSDLSETFKKSGIIITANTKEINLDGAGIHEFFIQEAGYTEKNKDLYVVYESNIKGFMDYGYNIEFSIIVNGMEIELHPTRYYEDTLKLGPNYYTFLTKCMFDYKLDENNRIERFIVRVNGEQYYFDV